MKSLFLILAVSLFSVNALADQGTSMTCKGDGVILKEISPYLGENSPFEQSLFILSADEVDTGRDQAFFLDIEYTIIGSKNHNSADFISINGTNNVGGKFELVVKPFVDAGDGTTIYEKTTGHISFSHGPLKGDNVPVSCVIQ